MQLGAVLVAIWRTYGARARALGQWLIPVLAMVGASGCQVRESLAPLEWELVAVTPTNASITNQKVVLTARVRSPGPDPRQGHPQCRPRFHSKALNPEAH